MKTFETKVKKIVQETSDSYSFIFDIPEGFEWKAGQHTAWTFPEFDLDKKEQRRIFTIASAPADGFLMFTTRIREEKSPYKEALLNDVKPGSPVIVNQALGKYSFHDTKKKSLCVAGGIGITPIRALVKDLYDNNDPSHEIKVIYSDESGEFCYSDFWKEAQEKLENLTVEFIKDTKVCTDTVKKYAEENGDEAEYLIAGSPGMNKAYEGMLQEWGISKDSIVLDVFMGY